MSNTRWQHTHEEQVQKYGKLQLTLRYSMHFHGQLKKTVWNLNITVMWVGFYLITFCMWIRCITNELTNSLRKNIKSTIIWQSTINKHVNVANYSNLSHGLLGYDDGIITQKTTWIFTAVENLKSHTIQMIAPFTQTWCKQKNLSNLN